jgi:hypothetical protein
MPYQFRKHYTREEARKLLPQLRAWLGDIHQLRQRLDRYDQQLSTLLTGGADAGGRTVNDSLKARLELERVLLEFNRREIQIKDLDRGLIDFPAIVAGREVFLCWEMDEDDVEYWHELDTGYAGREKLS